MLLADRESKGIFGRYKEEAGDGLGGLIGRFSAGFGG